MIAIMPQTRVLRGEQERDWYWAGSTVSTF